MAYLGIDLVIIAILLIFSLFLHLMHSDEIYHSGENFTVLYNKKIQRNSWYNESSITIYTDSMYEYVQLFVSRVFIISAHQSMWVADAV